jgi:hypothetical protein
VEYNINPFSLKYLAYDIGAVFNQNALFLAMALPVSLYFVRRVYQGRGRSLSWWCNKLNRSLYWRSMAVLTVLFVFSAISLMSLGKEGGGPNYALPLQFTVALLCGILVAQVLSGWKVLRMGMTGHAAVALILATGLSILWLAKPLFRLQDKSAQDAALRERAKLIELVRGLPTPVYSEDLVLLVQAGKEIFAEPAIITALERTGVWNEKPFVDMIRGKQFGLIITEDLSFRDFFTPAVREAIVASYRDRGQVGALHLYWPR